MSTETRKKLRKQFFEYTQAIKQAARDHSRLWLSALDDNFKKQLSWYEGLELLDTSLVSAELEKLTYFVHEIISMLPEEESP